MSATRQSSAGWPSSSSTTLRCAAVTMRTGPAGWQPCVTRETRATSALKATPDKPPRQTPSAICAGTVRDDTTPPKR